MTKKLTKSATDVKVFGVCGGIAEYFNIDSTLVRLIVFALMWVFGTGLMLYIAAAIILPEPHSTTRYRGDKTNHRKDVTPD